MEGLRCWLWWVKFLRQAQRAHTVASRICLSAVSREVSRIAIVVGDGSLLGVRHPEGKQQVYTRCPCDSHKACFRYAIVEQFRSMEHAVAFMTVWAVRAVELDPASLTKEQHKKYNPPERLVRSVIPSVVDAEL